MGFSQTIFTAAEYIGVIAAAISGAMVALEHALDLFGVVFVSILTALGGGCLRDVLLGYIPPRMFDNYRYLLLATLVAIAVFVLAAVLQHQAAPHWQKLRPLTDRVITISDAIGLGIFTVNGIQAAIDVNYGDHAFLCVFLGLTTGIGGGILRDVLTSSTPTVLRKHIYAVASIIGGIVYYGLLRANCPTPPAAAIGIGLIVLIRLLAAHFRWNFPRLRTPMILHSSESPEPSHTPKDSH